MKFAAFLTVLTLAWGALAFGAVYPWAFWTMAACALMAGSTGLATARARSSGPSTALLLALAAVAAAIAVQLIPLPLSTLVAVDRNGVDLLRQLDLSFALSPVRHAISMFPRGTVIALGLFVSLAVLLAGTTRVLSVIGAKRIVETIAILGASLAVIGIVQKPLSAGKIYGFWVPEQIGNPFGPFVNKNHFAGWMLLGIPLVLGYMCARIAKGMRGVGSEWRSRFLWLSSSDANKLLLAALAIAVMSLALVLTESRSGITCLTVALTITGWAALKRLEGRPRKMIALAYLVLLATIAVAWVGLDVLLKRFSEPGWGELNGRLGAWADALSTIKRHWLTGTGLNSYQVVNLVYQRHDTGTFVSEAHNDYLQLAAEGGLMVAVPILVCLVAFVRDVRRLFREDGKSSSYWLRVGAVTGLLAIALQETFDFSLQIPGNAAFLAVVCAIALHRNPSVRAQAGADTGGGS